MVTLQVSDELASTIQTAASQQHMSVEEYLLQVVRRERTLAQQRKVEDEMAWWFAQPMVQRARYEGEFIAVHEHEVVDHDQDKVALHRRIRAKYGQTAVLIIPAEGPRDILIYSPQLDRS
ncbi:hypothetical protein GC175_12080 [bacterium]|nr:hypothetical protein [bacterium]